MNNLLINREYTTEGNWYKPTDKLSEFKSVIDVKYLDQTSSAGDWSGYFVQKIKDLYYVILFSQVNNFPSYGFTLYTDKAVITSKEKITDFEEVENFIIDFYYN